MEFLVVFSKTGDEITFRSLNSKLHDLMIYFVDNLNQDNENSFILSQNNENDIDFYINELNDTLVAYEDFIGLFTNEDFFVRNNKLEYLDQVLLNNWHAKWVKLQRCRFDIDKKISNVSRSFEIW